MEMMIYTSQILHADLKPESVECLSTRSQITIPLLEMTFDDLWYPVLMNMQNMNLKWRYHIKPPIICHYEGSPSNHSHSFDSFDPAFDQAKWIVSM